MKAQHIIDRAEQTGIVWLGGEMEFPANQGQQAAYDQACHVAEECSYVVGSFCNGSIIKVSGGEISGYVELDWFHGDRLVKVTVWNPDGAYAKEPKPCN